ncbi:MAG: hypothetical protein QXS70_07075 [Desulfurococcaceae archaeon]
MGCYAFREMDCKETLAQHVLGIIKCLNEAWEAEGLKRKISRIHNVSELVVSDMLLLAGIMHDLGKTKKELQDSCSKECLRFKQHYIISARLALKLGYGVQELDLSPDNIENKLRELLNNKRLEHLDPGDTYLLVVVLPILFHHYSQVVDESSIFEGLDSAERFLEMHEDCITELVTVISEASKSLKSEVGLKIMEELKSVMNKGSIELSFINSKMLKEVSESYECIPGRLIVEAATGLLNLCDGRVAFNNRRCAT